MAIYGQVWQLWEGMPSQARQSLLSSPDCDVLSHYVMGSAMDCNSFGVKTGISSKLFSNYLEGQRSVGAHLHNTGQLTTPVLITGAVSGALRAQRRTAQ